MEKLLTPQQVAAFLGLHIKTFLKKLRNNEISLNSVQVTRARMGFKPQEVERFIASRTIVRNGNGVPIKSKKKVKWPKPFLTDEEAQAFFEGIEFEEDEFGKVLLSKDKESRY